MALAERELSRASETLRLVCGTMMDLEALSDFVLVAKHGGVTQAARGSKRPKASLSRKVMELEAKLGVRLSERGSRSVRLTSKGEALFARTAGPLADIEEAGDLLRDGRAQPRGRLRITVPAVFGHVLLSRLFRDGDQALAIRCALDADERLEQTVTLADGR